MSPANLYPKKETKLADKIELWLNAHAFPILLILTLVLMILLIALVYAVVGVSATDSGTYFNHIKDVI